MLFSLEKLYSTAQSSAVDRAAAQRPGCTGTLLMERAGAAAYSMLRRLWPTAQRLGVVCGAGNNGGDGYVLARLAHLGGLDVHLTAVAGTPRAGGEADTARHWFLACGGRESTQLPTPDAEVLVDGLLGTGLDRAPAGATAQAIDTLNASGRPVLALDLPSGLHADTGDTPGAAVRATATVSFVVRKRGLYTGRARALCGQLAFDALGVAPDPADPAAEAVLLDPARLRAAWLPARARHAHKGDFGHVLVIGGDHGFGGAARLAGTASARAGAGLTTVATRPAHVPALLSGRPELMVRGLDTAAELLPL